MKNRKNTDENCVDSILKLTKNLVQNTYDYHNYYIHKNNNLFSNQLPLLTQSKSTNLIIKNTNKKNKLTKQIPFPLKLIRRVEKRSNKIPKLYSINNNKREVVSLKNNYSQIHSRNSSLKSLNKSTNSSNSSLGSFPIKIKKKSISLNNTKNNSFDEFQNNFLIKNVISAIFQKALNNKRKIEPFSKAKIAAITSLLRLVMIDFERWYSEYDALAKTKQIFIKNQELQKRNQQLESIVSSRSVQIWLKINKALRK